jgi:hypothetical protein
MINEPTKFGRLVMKLPVQKYARKYAYVNVSLIYYMKYRWERFL